MLCEGLCSNNMANYLELLTLTGALAIILASLYYWKKYSDRNYILISLFGLVAMMISIWSYLGRIPQSYSISASCVLVAIISWYQWKKFNDKKYLWYSLLSIASLLIGIYGLYIAKVNLSLPIQDWPISSYIFLVIVVSIILVGILI